MLAEFSTLKILLGQNFIRFNSFFNAKLLKLFLVPANTFDNVKGSFPIGFFIWDTSINERFSSITADVFDANDHFIGFKKIQKPEETDIRKLWNNNALYNISKNIVLRQDATPNWLFENAGMRYSK